MAKGALPEIKYPLIKLVPPNITVYQGRADYKAKTGLDAPPPDTTRQAKNWVDNTAKDYPGHFVKYWSLAMDGLKVVKDSATGKALIEEFILPKEEAMAINFGIETAHSAAMSLKGSAPLPIRPLFDDEDIIVFDPFSGPVVINTDLYYKPHHDAEANDQMVVEVLDIVKKIAAKIGA
jgi:hypothetical protein